MGFNFSKQPEEDSSDFSDEEYDSDSSEMDDNRSEDMAADAAKTTTPLAEVPSRFPFLIQITDDQVLKIQEQLETYEKISLTYLLYEEPHIALQNVQMLLVDKYFNNLTEWVKYERSSGNRWQEKLAEALAIIQNYQVLRELRCRKEDMYNRFLPLTKTTAINVNRIRKCLYRMCEDFTQNETQRFLAFAEKDLKALPDYKTQEIYLEMYLLYFETEKYINCKSEDDAVDLNNIVKICKYMELDNLRNELEKFSKPNIPKQASEEVMSPPGIPPQQDSPIASSDEQFDLEEFDKTPSSLSFNKLIKKKKSKKAQLNVFKNDVFPKVENVKYDIDPKNPGVLIIINNEHFWTDYRPNLANLLPSPQQLEQREGTTEDEKNLKDTFEKFGFRVICFNDLTHEDILIKIKEVIRDIKEESSLFIAVLSHGNQGVVYGSNSIPTKVPEIQNVMCCPALAGKPKVLILQSCQGTEVLDLSKNDDLSTDGPTPNVSTVPKITDLLVFWATVPKYAAIRHKKSGTWFIQALCKMLKEKSDYHFSDICVFVQKEVTEKRWDQKVMVPLVETTFSKFLYLPKFEVK